MIVEEGLTGRRRDLRLSRKVLQEAEGVYDCRGRSYREPEGSIIYNTQMACTDVVDRQNFVLGIASMI